MLGKKVADFTAVATGGDFKLSKHKGEIVVLYFYPKDNTPGCTTEGEQFRDAYPKFRRAGAIVVGCSRDSLKSHENFKSKMSFPFELIADIDEKLCTQFDVIKMKNMYGKAGPGNRAVNVPDRWRGQARWRMARGSCPGPCGRGAGRRQGALPDGGRTDSGDGRKPHGGVGAVSGFHHNRSPLGGRRPLGLVSGVFPEAA